MLFLFRCTLHLERAREYLPPGHQTPNQGLMKEFQAGNLPSACHEKSFSHVQRTKATNRLPSPDSGGMIGLRVHFAFRWKLETANRRLRCFREWAFRHRNRLRRSRHGNFNRGAWARRAYKIGAQRCQLRPFRTYQ